MPGHRSADAGAVVPDVVPEVAQGRTAAVTATRAARAGRVAAGASRAVVAPRPRCRTFTDVTATKIPCARCGVPILPATAHKYGGLCAPCATGRRDEVDASRQRAEDEAARRASAAERRAATPLYADVDDVVAALASITDPNDEAQLFTLELGLRSLPQVARPEVAVPGLLAVFERFPWDDGYGTFWSILHALERLPSYEPQLVESVRRSPGEFNLLMVQRLRNYGVEHVNGTCLADLLGEIADGAASHRARERARTLLEQ